MSDGTDTTTKSAIGLICLGGSDSYLVLEDADLDLAATIGTKVEDGQQ